MSQAHPPGPSGSPAPALDARTASGLGGSWQRLHPLSALVRTGRGLIPVLLVVLIPTGGRRGSLTGDLTHVTIILVFFVLGLISWLVTRWRLEGDVLRVESGLLRRTSERFPLSQIQAIDTVRPGLARLFGLAELRIRLAGGGGKAGRLAYLTNDEAEALRARLLALSQGQAHAQAAPPERRQAPLLTVPTARLLASILLSGTGLLLEFVLAALIVLAVLSPAAATAVLSAGTAPLLGLAFAVFRRFNGDFRMTVTVETDGLRLRSGLIETSAEHIPWARIQAIRSVEPWAWRPCGWCRLEVDVASQKSKGRQDKNQAKAARALLPVGSRGQASSLLAAVFPETPEERIGAPARARWKSPLRFRQLSWGSNERYAVTTSGRLQRVTDWVPLEKVQSVRWVQGPVQRRLGLASIHLDTAGRRVNAVLRDRDQAEGRKLLSELPGRCRRARKLEPHRRTVPIS